MSTLSQTNSIRKALSELFDAKPPVLVEVRFPSMGTSSDWFLCEDERELSIVLDRLSPGTQIHLRSVWDLADRAAVVLNR